MLHCIRILVAALMLSSLPAGAIEVESFPEPNGARPHPASEEWREWPLLGDDAATHAVYVDEHDMVWLREFGGSAILRFDPSTEAFGTFPIPREGAAVRQMLGREGEVWAAESGAGRLTVYRHD